MNIRSHTSPALQAWCAPAAVPALLAVVLLLAGCGYTTKSLFPADVHTVGVPIFDMGKQVFYEGVEFDLTEALQKQIETQTPYKVVAPDQADTILHGRIVAVSQTPLDYTREGGVPQEMQVLLTVDVEWKNARTGRVLKEAKGLQATGRYVPTQPVGEVYANGQHQAVALMADKIVAQMRGDW
jgi:hypothetical protein